MTRLFLPLALTLLLAACSGGGTVRSAPAKPKAQTPAQTRVAVRPPTHVAPPKPRVLAAPGLEGVIGAAPDDLFRQFGAARLDVWEGDARKLQFSGTACILDVYFYPGSTGRVLEATYVDARRASDGQDVDRAACVNSLRRK